MTWKPFVPLFAALTLLSFTGCVGVGEGEPCEELDDCTVLACDDDELVECNPNSKLCDCVARPSGPGGDGGSSGGPGSGGNTGNGGTTGGGGTGGSVAGTCDALLAAGLPGLIDSPALSSDTAEPGDSVTLRLPVNENVREVVWLLIRPGFGTVAANGNVMVSEAGTLTIDFTVEDVGTGTYKFQALLIGANPQTQVAYVTPDDCVGPLGVSIIENGVEGPLMSADGCRSIFLAVE